MELPRLHRMRFDSGPNGTIASAVRIGVIRNDDSCWSDVNDFVVAELH